MDFELLKEKMNVYILQNHLKQSNQREDILRVFYDSGKHQTAEDLHQLLIVRGYKIGIATIYRNLQLFKKCGICNELRLEDGKSRFELIGSLGHHDHLICTKCGSMIEIVNQEIERIQEEIAKSYSFSLISHRLELYGICSKCQII